MTITCEKIMSPNSQVSRPIVFISYSHLDEAWKDLMLPHFKHLERLGVLEVWNDRDIGHGADWYAVLKDKLEQTRFAVCLVSANFLSSRFCMEEEIPYLLQRQAERGVLVLPVLVEDCLWEAERWLSRTQMLPRDKQNLTTHFRDDPAPIFKRVAKTIYDALQPDYVAPSPAPPAGTPPEKIDINRLPETGELLFGRREEMTLLDEAWDSDKTNVVVLKAGGGVGKSTLMRVWTKSLQQDNFRGAERVFAWSFYSQGTGERVTSADMFIANALDWFGDPDSTAGSPWDKGERLARLVAEHRTLLLLDGMEPLQSHVKEENGAIKDPGLQMLVRDLARHNPGLCVISTRETVGDLTDSRFAGSVVHEDLDHVSLIAGRALMRVRGVHGEDSALEATVEQFDRHALAINLLASYLTEFESGDIASVAEVVRLRNDAGENSRSLTTSATEQDQPERRVIAAFEQRLQDTPELNLLCILGLFDRPISGGEFRALTAEPPIPGLTDRLLAGTGADTGLTLPAGASLVDRRILDRLRKFGLIAPESHHEPNEIDAHPLIREHFTARLVDHFQDGAREAHRRLYEHLKNSPGTECPGDFQEILLLYRAVRHGCLANHHRQALNEVLRPRVMRDDVGHATRNFGCFADERVSLAGFYEREWDLSPSLEDQTDQIVVLRCTGYCLWQLSKVKEGADLMRRALEMAQSANDCRNASIAARNLGHLYLSVGDLSTAAETLRAGVLDADQFAAELELSPGLRGDCSKVFYWPMALRCSLAYVLLQRRGLQARDEISHLVYQATTWQHKSETAVDQATTWQHKRETVVLDLLPGFHYWEFLNAAGDYDKVLRLTQSARGRRQKDTQKESVESQASGLEALASALAHAGKAEYEQAKPLFREAVTTFHQLGRPDFEAHAMLARAGLFVRQQELDAAEDDMEKAREIAERGDIKMRLHLVDAHLIGARLHLARHRAQRGQKDRNEQTQLKQAYKEMSAAAELIEETRYHRRDDELARLQAEIDQEGENNLGPSRR